ncbi:DUF4132 domain-containing protein [Actinomadura rugatobispora]|uniref:DUF4132 domain-containing protein n=1 Tax=Actinomadura rugatobispora TaxID=1994 RepID=A0ABW1A783_9ACTN|nr:hypothetical protein GCM10010200_055370 [Actinomadura rugatobispora]
MPNTPESSLPELLVNPPWTASKQPVVLKLKAPKEPTTMTWAPGRREEWLAAPYQGKYGWQPLPDDTDWNELAETFSSGRALTELDAEQRRDLGFGLLAQAPLELGDALLSDQRHWDAFTGYGTATAMPCIVARHGLAAYPMAMHLAKNSRTFYWLDPFLDTDVAQLMIKHCGVYPNRDRVEVWFKLHGEAAALLAVPDALRKPGPKRERAEEALRIVAKEHGHDAIVRAARHYGDEAAAAMSVLRTDGLDIYPDPLPETPEAFDPARLPQILLRDRKTALPAPATRHLLTMLTFSKPWDPYPGVEQVIDLFDPDSLAAFAWALYEADTPYRSMANRGVQYALARFGNDDTADRLAPIIARWSKSYVYDIGGFNLLSLFTRLGSDSALRHLHRLANKAEDHKRIRASAQGALNRIAKERGLTSEQLADRLVPDFGLDSQGGLTLDYGPRSFRVGFDEQLKPYVTDADGKRRKTLPKPGVKDDDTLAPAAYKRFTDLKKDVRTVAADQIKRLEKAMVTGRSWTFADFRSLFIAHPLLCHIARRLIWSADVEGRPVPFRVAEDRTLADADDKELGPLPDETPITLPHPVLLGGPTVEAWGQVFADYELLQPFQQLARTVHALTDEERGSTKLTRFEGGTVHFGRILGMTSRGWELGEKETGGFRRQVMLMTPDERHLMVQFEPGIRVIAPEDFAEQDIRDVSLFTGRYSGKRHPFGELDPVTASELLTDLTRLTDPPAN